MELTRLEYLHQVVVDNVPTDPRQPSYAKGKKDRIDGREVIKFTFPQEKHRIGMIIINLNCNSLWDADQNEYASYCKGCTRLF